MEKDTDLYLKLDSLLTPNLSLTNLSTFPSLYILICKMGLMEDFIWKVGIKEIKRDDVGTLCPK